MDSLNPQQLRALHLLASPTLDFREVELLVKSDPALCFRLLRYLNSAAFCFQEEITSIFQALMLLGETELRKWLFVTCAIVPGRNTETVKTALVRARFSELLGTELRTSGSILFLLGLLSLLDAMLEVPLAHIIEKLAIPSELRSALLGSPGELRDCLDLVLTYEKGDWPSCERLAKKCGVPIASLAKKYVEALRWAESAIQNDLVTSVGEVHVPK